MGTVRQAVKFDCQKMQSMARKKFPSVANNAISPLCEMTFNEYLIRKGAHENRWEDMPANHGVGEPALIAQVFELNITVVWVVGLAWHMWCLPYGGDDPFLVLLYSNLATTTNGACISIAPVAATVPRFFALQPLVSDWENSAIFCEIMPESQPAGFNSIQFKSGDKEFAFQSVVTVEGSLGSDESSEVTTASQFFNDFVDDSSLPPDDVLMTPPEIRHAVITRLEAKIAHIKAVNAVQAQFTRRRHISDDDDE